MKQWYYSEGGQQRGPIGEAELKSLLAARGKGADVLVWADGMDGWKPAAEIFGSIAAPSVSAFSPYAPPVSEVTTAIDWSGYEATGSQARPWVRYWARTFDYFLFCIFVGAIAIPFFPEIEEMNDTLLGGLLLFGYNFVEPVMLATIGTTPFKALLRVRVRNGDGSKLSYLQGLRRAFSVWLKGSGLGIPLIALIEGIVAYRRLSSTGITSWDESGNFTVSHKDIQWWRWVLLVLPLIGFVALLVIADSQV